MLSARSRVGESESDLSIVLRTKSILTISTRVQPELVTSFSQRNGSLQSWILFCARHPPSK